MCYASVPGAEPQTIAPPVATKRYIPGLDGLRAIAVMLVIAYHCEPQGLVQGGFIGVDLFFVLSAFLITSILVDEKERTGAIRLGRFYWRRMLRLMPALLLFLTTYAVIAPMIISEYPHLRDAAIAGLYISNFAFVAWQIPLFIKHTWSLAAEEQFYLLWPVILIMLLRTKRPMLLLGVVWVGLTAMRLAGDDWVVNYYGLAHHGTGLVLGAILFFLVRAGKFALRPVHALFAAALLAVTSLNAQLGAAALPISVAEFASAVIIGTVVTNPAGLQLLAARPLVVLGKLSYGLFLWNYPIALVMRSYGGFWETFAITFALSLGLAALSYVTIESWTRRLRSGHKSGAPAPAEFAT
jgi:peptidoglycan/LPS O-acetylase OafA/YrhL